ncbi:hypothetical protein NLG97_g9061 [Lecanicillium saksenae]|uniref:Uncharacterized protein n=1 Tax=Lecanicillium saksenae TaxID=468837 RepID=A0ACC1QK33_9HYPO|nr:hypothetical protein NLG97_g9061 [Lecanicillium saksenae]
MCEIITDSMKSDVCGHNLITTTTETACDKPWPTEGLSYHDTVRNETWISLPDPCARCRRDWVNEAEEHGKRRWVRRDAIHTVEELD